MAEGAARQRSVLSSTPSCHRAHLNGGAKATEANAEKLQEQPRPCSVSDGGGEEDGGGNRKRKAKESGSAGIGQRPSDIMELGEAAVPLSCFVEQFSLCCCQAQENANPFGSWSRVVCISSKKTCGELCQQHCQRNPANQGRGDVLI